MISGLREFVKARTSKGLRHALRLVHQEWILNRRHRRAIKKIYKSIKRKTGLQLHLGCGDNLISGWINIDLFEPNADAQLDLREDWPFASNSASRVYSEHTLEHFEYPLEVRHFLAETFRVLRPGGIMDVGVPDTGWPLAAYGDNSNDYWRLSRELWVPDYSECETQLDLINYHFRLEGEHKYAWDAETLTKELRRAGFVSIEQREFDPSFNLESRRFGTLYMRAQKPA